MTSPIGPGAFIAVTGASGVGKDTLLDAAREQCGDDVVFPRRTITRPIGSGEDYLSVNEQDFMAARERGEFAVSWQAHGLHYGVPSSVDAVIRAGGVVVSNVSRGVVEELRNRYERIVTVRITVSDGVRAARLHTRNRETAEGIAGRLTRVDPAAGHRFDHEIHNDRSVRIGADTLLHIIHSAAERETSSARK